MIKHWKKLKILRTKCNSSIIIFLRKAGIFKRLILAFTTLLVSAAAFITYFSFYQYSQVIETNIKHYITLLVQNVNLKIDEQIRDYEENAIEFYSDPDLLLALKENAKIPRARTKVKQEQYKTNKAVIEHKLYSLRRNQKYMKNIQFVTPKEQYHMADSYGFRTGGCIKDLKKFYTTPFYLIPQERKGYPVWFDTDAQTTVFFHNEQSVYGISDIITLCISVYDPLNREFLGVLIFNIDFHAFSGALGGYETEDAGNTFLIGENGVLFWFNPKLSAPAFPKDMVLFDEMKQTGQGLIQRTIDQHDTYVSYQQISGTDILVAHIADKEYLLSETYRIRNLCIVVLAGIVIGCFLISYYVTISISHPVNQLVEIMKKTGAGNWTVRYSNYGKDEISLLGNNFNNMIDQVYMSEIHRKDMALHLCNAQLDALQMQINPHFLYNTLDIIRWESMYETDGESPVSHMIEKFSQLCRMGMKAGGKTISLAESIEHAKIYLDVINFRHTEKIKLTIKTELDTWHIYIPQFTLQPIMENAVVHGFKSANKSNFISIQAYEQDHCLHLTIEDNGIGMSEQDTKALQQELDARTPTAGSIGLKNVNRRIKLFYGYEYGIKVESKETIGTVVYLTIPIRTSSEDMEKDYIEDKEHVI